MRLLTSIKNNGGFTLVELMVAMIIVAVGMFGVLESINVTLQHNLKNELRNEGIRIGEKYMTDLRGKPFDKYSTVYTPVIETANIRGGSKPYRVERTSQVLGIDDSTGNPTTRQLTVTVKWAYRNMTSLNQVVSVVAQP